MLLPRRREMRHPQHHERSPRRHRRDSRRCDAGPTLRSRETAPGQTRKPARLHHLERTDFLPLYQYLQTLYTRAIVSNLSGHVMNANLQFTLNGKPQKISTDSRRTLLEVLREDLDLTGTKYGCGEGQCRACT